MTVEHIKAGLNMEYLLAFCKKVGVAMRRLNISCTINNRATPGALEFNKVSFDLRYIGYKYTMLMDEQGTKFTLLDKSGELLTTTDLRDVKNVMVKQIKAMENLKKAAKSRKEAEIKEQEKKFRESELDSFYD